MDVEDVAHVVNYDAPVYTKVGASGASSPFLACRAGRQLQTVHMCKRQLGVSCAMQTYVHRCGRSARAGKAGCAYTLLRKEVRTQPGIVLPAIMRGRIVGC